jgi:hypothetical protein
MLKWITESGCVQLDLRAALADLLRIQLFNNDIQFDGAFYKQVKGISMGWSPSPTVANFFLKGLDELILSFSPLIYVRFIDDVFLCWETTRPGLDELMRAANEWDPSIQLLWAQSDESATFLDMTVFKPQAAAATVEIGLGNAPLIPVLLQTGVHFKATDTHALLHRTSCHAQHTFRGIVKSQLIRFYRLCSARSDAAAAVELLFGVLRKRGYPAGILQAIHHEVQTIDLSAYDLGQQQVDADESVFVLPMPFSPQLAEASEWIQLEWAKLIRVLPADQNWLPQHLTVAWRKNATLKNLLVRTAFASSQAAASSVS